MALRPELENLAGVISRTRASGGNFILRIAQGDAGELSLDDAMKAFEKGIKLTRDCQESLSQAEQKVQVLMEKNGTETLEPLESDPDTE